MLTQDREARQDKQRDNAEDRTLPKIRIGDLVIRADTYAEIIGYQEAFDAIVADFDKKVEFDGGDVNSTYPNETGGAAADRAQELSSPFRIGRIGRPTKPFCETLESRSPDQQLCIQVNVSKPFALAQQLSLDTLRQNPDYYSAFNISPQPDGGRGMVAMAGAYVKRERARAETNGASADKTVVWAYSNNGLDLRDFLESIREQDEDGVVAKNTRAVLACDSQEKLDAIENSDL